MAKSSFLVMLKEEAKSAKKGEDMRKKGKNKGKGKRIAKAVCTVLVLATLIAASCRYIAGRYDVRWIISGSMAPALKIGTICVIDKKATHPEEGQIACYVRDTDSLLITHRMCGRVGKLYAFRGDANQDFDPFVPQNQIYGTVVFHTSILAGALKSSAKGKTKTAIVRKKYRKA